MKCLTARLTLLLALLPLLLGTLAGGALARDLAQLEPDFAPRTGCVVLSIGNEFLVDLDADQGLTAGDLLAVVEQGGDVIHPVTKEVIGTLDKTLAVLQVSQVKDGYSYTRLLRGEAAALKAGTLVRRYSGLTARFHDASGSQEALYARLKAGLPALQWSDGEGAADLLFEATVNGLQVRDAAGQLIRAYAPAPGRSLAALTPPTMAVAALPATATIAAPAASPSTMPLAVAPAAPASPANLRYDAPLPSATPNGALSMEFPRFVKRGQLSHATQMADFEAIGGELLLATTDGGRIEIYRLGEQLTPFASGDSITMGRILNLSWWQPSAGDAYLAVTVWSDKRVYSDLLQLQGQQLVPVISGYGSLLAGFDIDSDGRSEQLLGQEFSREHFYGSPVWALSLAGNRLAAQAPAFELPANFRLFGALITDITGDGQAEVAFVRNRRLYIYSGTQQLYKSSKELGASVSTVTYDIDPDAQNPMITSASCEVAPVAADLDGDGLAEIVAIAADANLLQNVGVASAINKSWLAVFKFQQGMVMKGTLGDSLERPLQGLAVQQGQALMVATEISGLLDKHEASYVLAVPLR
ncbi:VCBS repeat-containing protein [Desulfuromonas thiophila]|uniref:FG-GAP repeat domain-containing protein n=1 Tax=Desulfuromonas thiophila TaxID=57664 RepID=UPI0029F49F21|nr:VCBS repeat-containing protein [Desulfuromonas thiophila]